MGGKLNDGTVVRVSQRNNSEKRERKIRYLKSLRCKIEIKRNGA